MLSLARNRLGEEGTKAICEALEQNKSLKEIDISGAGNHTGIGGSAGAKHVANMLGVNGSLTSVKLRGNTLGDEGWGAIFAAICGNKDSKIMSMDASDENIGPIGVKLIAESLRTSVTGALTSINLSKNRLTNFGGDMTGIKELAAALGVNGGLTALDLSFNNLNDDSVSAVCEAIQSNKETKLASLNMGANSIGPVGAKSVAAMVAVTGTLMECDVSNNAMGEEGKASIRFVAQGKAGFNLHL
ncbi:protein nlrc3 [Chrysochromulina tobinii]|uniref:Protein nlrc3 n=1 Tax=Chrysochromulina tobinii TaxID=1460289 RepID=A0A0M0K5J9_9EUKA|nr:protein nlrc3 [Chrysochromulina tobinii]|eukprot:KOO34136.1 protein nlrc3 [Chrysochromulina sp. CCMP291]